MRLEASELAVERGGRVVFSNVSFTIDSGESLIVTGRNGAGKSTLLRALAGFLPSRAGEIALTPASEESLAEHVHYVGHADALKGALTVSENLAFLGSLLGCGRGGLAVQAALGELGLAHLAEIPAAYLSAGQKRRVSLAKLRVAFRPIWLLDEPSNALDALAQKTIRKLMRAHLEGGGMIVAATHAPLDLPGRELRLGAPA